MDDKIKDLTEIYLHEPRTISDCQVCCTNNSNCGCALALALALAVLSLTKQQKSCKLPQQKTTSSDC